MTNERFDQLTKSLSKTASRRTVFKGVMAAAVGGMLARFRGGDSAAARARVRMACARLGQPCATGTGTPGNMICCPDLTCGVDAVCCKDTNQTCLSNDDCCGDNTCRPNPSGLGNRCLPPGDVGAECIEDLDCLGTLGCDAYTGTCENICDGVTCTEGQTCCGDAYTLSSICCGGPNETCDGQLGACVSCAEYGDPCSSDSECCDNLRDGNAVCGLLPNDTSVGSGLTLLEISGYCCVPEGGSCAAGPCCNGLFCSMQEVCEPAGS
jgi:hypothetical protein